MGMQITTLSPKAALAARAASQQLAVTQSLEFRSSNGEIITIPTEALPLMQEVLTQLANRKNVVVLPLESELSTFEAADILGVSRPFLTKLLERGELPCRMVGTHHRIRLADVLCFQEIQQQRSLEAMQALTKQSQELGLF